MRYKKDKITSYPLQFQKKTLNFHKLSNSFTANFTRAKS